jgi:hypothetical protein
MSSAPPMYFAWNGEAMVPRAAHMADRHFVIGEQYMMVEHHERSSASHAHYFAAVNEAWQSLPEGQAERFPTPEHLRKYAMIKAGHHDSRSVSCGSKAEALRVASFIQPMDEYAIVTVSGAVVSVFTAKSQSYRAMGKADFEASKEAVLNIVAEMVGVDTDSLAEAGRRTAA